MAGTLNVYVAATMVVDGTKTTIGSTNTPIAITVTGVKHENTLSLAANTTKELLRVGTADGDDIADFDFLYVVCSTNATLEIQGTTAADNSLVALKASTPFILSLDDTSAYHASARIVPASAAAQNIAKIYIRTTGTATAYVLAIT